MKLSKTGATFLVFTCLTSPISAEVVAGIDIPDTLSVSGQTLQLNGAGVRTVTFVFVPIKAYVASFYSPSPLRSSEAVQASPGPLQFNFTFLQGASQGQVTDAWNAQFKASVTVTYPTLGQDQAEFVAFFGALNKGTVHTVQFVGDETRILENGLMKGSIPGREFQRAFLSMWFGSVPVMSSLKTDLLGGSS